jgi:uncharacterized membrane protein YheB (UPF0754 family)
MNKSLLTNLFSIILIGMGFALDNNLVLLIGLFALSGAITNWLAIYLLFERVPGLIGSGVIPNQFEAFKQSIKTLMMNQFFTHENIDRFMSAKEGTIHLNLTPVIESVDLNPAFDRLVKVIMESSFGSMLGMFGGEGALAPLKEPFIKNMQASLVEMSESDSFVEKLKQQVDQPDMIVEIQQKVAHIIDSRLEDLTPGMVKQMVQKMIQQHLGWLVVWGGVFGALIGLITGVLTGTNL